MPSFYKVALRDKLVLISTSLLVIFLVWWLILHIFGNAPDRPHLWDYLYEVWSYSYQITALIGAFSGIFIARRWGGYGSVIGRASLMFSFGLFCQWFAQAAGAYLVWSTGTVPYPSLSDVGAFGAVFFYILGSFFLAKLSGVKLSLKKFQGKLISVFIPFIMLSVSFWFFLRSYQYDWTHPLLTFLDFGYPLGEAFYVSIAILAYLLSRQYLGGLMKIPVLFCVISLFSEYVADFMFLYDSHAGTYVPGGLNDLLFMISYSLMAISLILLGVVYNIIRNEKNL